MDIKLGILTLLNEAPLQKLVLAPGAIFRGNTAFVFFSRFYFSGFQNFSTSTYMWNKIFVEKANKTKKKKKVYVSI